jgi:hypothetical protein
VGFHHRFGRANQGRGARELTAFGGYRRQAGDSERLGEFVARASTDLQRRRRCVTCGHIGC